MKEKGEHQNYATSGEFAAMCGITPRTFRKWRSAGKVPRAEVYTPKGWALWSPSQVQEVLRRL